MKAVLCAVFAVFVWADIPPNPIYDTSAYRTLVQRVPNGLLYQVTVPATPPFLELHVYGTAFQRGFAQGQLLSARILDFVNNQLKQYYESLADQIPVGKLPAWLQKIVIEEAEKDAPGAINYALGWVYEQEKTFINSSQVMFHDEISGLAQGTCANKSLAACDPVAFAALLTNVNMLPELIKMHCSMMGVWGKATPDGKGSQLRTLDFGTGPFANNTLLVVHHPDSGFPFALISFPAMVGAVTGFSQYIGLSEKVDEVTGKPDPKGSFDGKPDALVIREILQFATSKENAVIMAQKAPRTWGVWLGFGDIASQRFLAIAYDQEQVIPYDDVTLPFATGAPGFEGVAYIDKHTQPSSSPTLPDLVKQYYGNLSAVNIVQNIPRLTQSGDVHIAVYDYGQQMAYVAQGITDAKGDFIRYAYESPFLRWSMSALWGQKL
jgi:hypothetical protein